MSYKENQLKKHMSDLSELDRLLYVRKLINSSISNLKSKNKAVIAESNFNYMGSPKRTASNRGGRATTLTAKAISWSQLYFGSLEDLKKAIKHL